MPSDGSADLSAETPHEEYSRRERLPFEVVEKSDRRTPLQQLHPTRCPHDRAYQTDKLPASGTHWVCADCGHSSGFVRDFQ